MRALSIELEDELVDALEAERELFGFESRQAYVRWIIEHRGSIRAEATAAEQRRSRAPDTETGDADREAPPSAPEAEVETEAATAETATDDERKNAAETVADDEQRSAAETTPDDEPILEVHGSPQRVRQGPDSRIRPDDDPADANASGDSEAPSAATGGESGTASAASAADADGGGDGDRDGNDAEASGTPSLTPERVARIREDPVLQDADVLDNVEAERLDELTRRAVATTRERLNRDVETGLEYRSSTRLADAADDVRPGADITDLEALSVPGRSDETVDRRREAVGRALAYLRDEGRARRSDFVDALYDEWPAGYGTADGWWRCIKTGLKQVDAVDGGEGARVWRYRE